MGLYSEFGRQAQFVPRVDGPHEIVFETDNSKRRRARCTGCHWTSPPGLVHPQQVDARAARHLATYGVPLARPASTAERRPKPVRKAQTASAPAPPSEIVVASRFPDLQEQLDWFYAVLEDAADRGTATSSAAADLVGREAVAAARDARLAAIQTVLGNGDLPLLLGQVQDAQGRSEVDVARLAVIDETGEVLASSWKSDAAASFYDPPAGKTRLRITEHDQQIVDVLTDQEVSTSVIDALEIRRDSYLRDILGTIQPDQFGLIRDALGGALVIQGGAGSGKTAVALHRASLLAYRHREELDGSRVLVLAPTSILLRYISRVLPTLGDDDIVHATIDGLVQRVSATNQDDPIAARIKGRRTMRFVLRSHILSKITAPSSDYESSDGTLHLDERELNRALDEVRARVETYAAGRSQLRAAWVRAIARENDRTLDDVESLARRDRSFQNLLDRSWPQLSAEQAVFELLTGPVRLQRAAAGILSAAERKVLLRKAGRLRDMTWSSADLALIDEARSIIERSSPSYDHIILDEAQDLSPMQLRMVERRSANGSYTVLGDLAQATAYGASVSWGELAEDLGLRTGFRYRELDRSYRTPAETLQFANRLLSSMKLDLKPPESIREGFAEPRLVQSRTIDVAETIEAEIWRHADETTAIGVICPTPMVERVVAHLHGSGIDAVDGRKGSIGADVTVLPAALAKGLEFDHVVVAEPSHVYQEYGDRGAQALYVALTRTTRTLSVVHQHPLPQQLAV